MSIRLFLFLPAMVAAFVLWGYAPKMVATIEFGAPQTAIRIQTL
jgi:hypothetical protein